RREQSRAAQKRRGNGRGRRLATRERRLHGRARGTASRAAPHGDAGAPRGDRQRARQRESDDSRGVGLHRPRRGGGLLGGRARRGVKAAGSPRGAGTSPRRPIGGEQVEGRQAVRELLAARTRPTRDVWMAEGLEPAPVLREINELAKKARVPVRYVTRRALEAEARTEGSQGVLAHAQPLPEWDFDELCRDRARTPFLLAFDGVTDPQNLGALL